MIAAAQGGVVLPAREPFDWPRLLDWLGARAIPGLEAVADGIYTRGGVAVARVDGGIEVSGEADPAVVARVFDVGHDPAALGDDPLFERAPGIRVPGAWSGWELAVRAVLGQQVSVAGARRTAQKLVAELGEAGRFPPPEALASGPLPGMPAARARALRALAEAVADGRVALDPGADRAETEARLREIPGLGPWTAQYVALRALGDPDVFLVTDLGVRRGAAALGLPADPAALAAHAHTHWAPWRSYATIRLWRQG